MSARKKTTFQEAMAADAFAAKLIRSGRSKREDYEASFARNILHEDLGYIGDDTQTCYHLDEDTRDRLIAHARQDAALACVSITGIRKEIRTLKLLLWLVVAIGIGLLLK